MVPVKGPWTSSFNPVLDKQRIADSSTLDPGQGVGDNRAVTEIGFAHVTTKTWAYLEMFDFFRIFVCLSLFENTMGNPCF